MIVATTSFHEVPGLLEYILSYSATDDLLTTALVCRRWKSVTRNDSIWHDVFERTVKAARDEDGNIPLFWRSQWTETTAKRMNEKQIRGILKHPLVVAGEDAKQFDSEDLTQLQRRLLKHMQQVMMSNIVISFESRFFSDVYFGAYACWKRDSKRETILLAELNSHLGFELFFKVPEADWDQSSEVGNLIPYEDHPGILLHFHSICYFRGNHSFEEDESDYRENGWMWRWVDDGKFVQVAQYPPLLISRQRDKRWKLENMYVVFLSRAG